MIATVSFILLLYVQSVHGRLSEPDRVELWFENGNVWPPHWERETLDYRDHQLKREDEIMHIAGADERWENWVQFTQAQLVPKLTVEGFELAKTPEHIHTRLLAAVKESLDDFDNIPEEVENVVAIYGPKRPKFVDISKIGFEVLDELKDLHERWAGGLKLMPISAYGVRFYQNGSSLIMHHDKVETHVISSIVHIAHEYDNDDEPWPIHIEDHNSDMHAINLQPGEILFYESAKCVHGRMQEFKGKYYGSLFLHYQPVDKTIWDFDVEMVIAAVPPHWSEDIQEDKGSRWAGQGLTIDSLSPAGIGPRIVHGDFIHDNKSPFSHSTPLPLPRREFRNYHDHSDEL